MHTRIGRYTIPVRCKWATLVTFWSGEHGKRDCGEYAFWTALLRRPVEVERRLRRRIFGRALVGEPVGDRFDRMQLEARSLKQRPAARKAYRVSWERVLREGRNVKFVRPSTLKEVKRWMESHESDAEYASNIARIGGKMVHWRRPLNG